MNLRFVAVNENGREIQDDDNTDIQLQPPVDSISVDSIPRVGEEVVFYNVPGGSSVWDVVHVIWMVPADESARQLGGIAHVCVMIRQREKA